MLDEIVRLNPPQITYMYPYSFEPAEAICSERRGGLFGPRQTSQ